MPTPPDALVERLAPKLQALFEAHRAELLSGVHGPLKHEALVLAFPHIDAMIPRLMRGAIDLTLAEFGSFSLNDAAACLANLKARQQAGD